jgi:site-specific DNA-methyltransferase (adenine-specific)
LSEEDVSRLGPKVLLPGDLTETLSFADVLVNGDILSVLGLLPDAFADLVIVDPPYNLTKTFRSTRFSAMPQQDYEDYLRTWFHGVCTKLKPGGSLYLCGDWKCSSSLQRVMEEELTVLNRITWQREKGRGASSNWKNAMEDIWFATVSDDYHFHPEAVMQRRRVLAPYRENGRPKDWTESPEGRFRDTFPSNFWDDLSVPFWSMPENTPHPAQKPEKLMARLILASTGPGAAVLDPFLGSGSSAVAAKKLGRRFTGIEREARYCAWAQKRLELAEQDPHIQGYADGVFWERNTAALIKRHRKP